MLRDIATLHDLVDKHGLSWVLNTLAAMGSDHLRANLAKKSEVRSQHQIEMQLRTAANHFGLEGTLTIIDDEFPGYNIDVTPNDEARTAAEAEEAAAAAILAEVAEFIAPEPEIVPEPVAIPVDITAPKPPRKPIFDRHKKGKPR